MKKLMTPFSLASLLSLASLHVLAGAVSVQAAAPDAEDGGEGIPLLDVNFQGGSAWEYVETVRRAMPMVNVLLDAKLKEIPMPPVELQQVSFETALALLAREGTTAEGMHYKVGVDLVQEASLSREIGEPVFTVRVIWPHGFGAGGSDSQPGKSTRFFSVADLVEGPYEPADVLTIIETALAMTADEGTEPPTLKFHDATAVLLASGRTSQLTMIEKAIDGVRDSQTFLQPEADGGGQERKLQAANEEIAHITGRLHDATSHLEAALRERAQSQATLALLQAEIQSLRRQREELQTANQQLKTRLIEVELTYRDLKNRLQRPQRDE